MGYFTESAEELYFADWEPVPLSPGQKGCFAPGWTTKPLSSEVLGQWGSAYPGAGIGLRTGLVRAVDIDVLDESLSEQLSSFLQARCPNPLVRIGKRPKTMLVYKTHNPNLAKRLSAAFVDGEGRQHRIEVLGRGQQFASFHVHPDTNEPYQWVGRTPLQTTPNDLPPLDERAIDDLIELFELAAVEKGWQRIASATDGFAFPEDADEDAKWLMSYAPTTQLPLEDLDDIIAQTSMDTRSDWLAAGMALHHETNGSQDGLAIWQAHSWDTAQQDCERNWDSFRSNPDDRKGPPMTVTKLDAYRERQTQQVNEAQQQKQERISRSTSLIKASDLTLAPGAFLIDGILEESATSLWFGTPASFKSFIAIDIACCIATGTPWHGHEVDRQGPAVYICGEGHAGIARRVEAWCRTHGHNRDDLEFYKTQRAMNFTSADAVKAFIDTVVNGNIPEPAIIFVDTIARNLGGDENSSEDFAALFDAIDDLREHFPRITVVLIGHPGLQDKTRPRGSSAQEGNVDSMVRMVRQPGSHYITKLVSMKMKDAVTFPDLLLGMKEVELGIDAKDRPFTSLSACAMEEAHRDSEAVVEELDNASMSDEEVVAAISRRILELLESNTEKFNREAVKTSFGDGFRWHNLRYKDALDTLKVKQWVSGDRVIEITEAGKKGLDLLRFGEVDLGSKDSLVHEPNS